MGTEDAGTWLRYWEWAFKRMISDQRHQWLSSKGVWGWGFRPLLSLLEFGALYPRPGLALLASDLVLCPEEWTQPLPSPWDEVFLRNKGLCDWERRKWPSWKAHWEPACILGLISWQKDDVWPCQGLRKPLRNQARETNEAELLAMAVKHRGAGCVIQTGRPQAPWRGRPAAAAVCLRPGNSSWCLRVIKAGHCFPLPEWRLSRQGCSCAGHLSASRPLSQQVSAFCSPRAPEQAVDKQAEQGAEFCH